MRPAYTTARPKIGSEKPLHLEITKLQTSQEYIHTFLSSENYWLL